MPIYNLKIDILDYWHAGSGLSAGTRVDALTVKDAAGLPYLPGRTLKGLLRDACDQLESWGAFNDQPDYGFPVTALLFGTRGSADQSDRTDVRPGLLLVNDARLSSEEIAWFSQLKGGNRAQISLLSREVMSTAIENKGVRKGIAKNASLRGMEVSVPMTLLAGVEVCPWIQGDDEWAQAQQKLVQSGSIEKLLKTLLPFVEAIGGNRTRGYGRAEISLTGVETTC